MSEYTNTNTFEEGFDYSEKVENETVVESKNIFKAIWTMIKFGWSRFKKFCSNIKNKVLGIFKKKKESIKEEVVENETTESMDEEVIEEEVVDNSENNTSETNFQESEEEVVENSKKKNDKKSTGRNSKTK